MRRITRWASAIFLTAASLSLVGCGAEKAAVKEQVKQEAIKWKLVTSWPKNFPGLGVAPERFAEKVGKMSGGRLTIKVYGAGELVPALQVFDAVSAGTAQMGHSGAYYWKGKSPAAQFFSTMPFGMTAQEMNAWLHNGGGLELWQEVYAPFGLVPLAGGNTDIQMGGWFNKEINSVSDLEGLKMRLPGLGGEVLKRAGGVPVNMPGGEIFTSLQTGAIDATEWVGPYNDLAFGLHKAAKYYYYPGWHEPGTTIEFMANKAALAALPEDLRMIVEVAAKATNEEMLDEYMVQNAKALKILVNEHGVELRQFPPEVMVKLKALTEEVLQEQVATDPQMKKVYDAYMAFLNDAKEYSKVSSKAYMELRDN
ncbi:TRAP transporter substrate-binding protein [Motilimonas sp. 1_MG-2023]|uniref:TRAP transporter substrate-binding protein n=1 Tax=Motilimonas TaxID=1914248 RepID=UPI0026E16530|nr:TRAP transporter substrate-binding protein [Motilimonas sp. 1_MG-2023]MDO6526462.1 TRAP transporter substrate-binding protein [Motilimonas sp. 1_MG-2023]